MTSEEIKKALNTCTFGYCKETRCKDCPLDSDKEPCITNLHLSALKYIRRIEAENAELKSSLTHANEECLKWHERAQNLLKDSGGSISGYKKKISDLQAENATLRERLEKAVELPCKVGDKVYGVGFTDCEDGHTTNEKKKRQIFNVCMKMGGNCEKCKYSLPAIEEFTCTHIQLGDCGIYGQSVLIVGDRNENYTENNVFTNRESAEARLKELKGEEE